MNDPIGTAWQVFVSHDRQVQAPPHLESRIMAATVHRPEPAGATGVVAFAFALAAAIAVAVAAWPVRDAVPPAPLAVQPPLVAAFPAPIAPDRPGPPAQIAPPPEITGHWSAMYEDLPVMLVVLDGMNTPQGEPRSDAHEGLSEVLDHTRERRQAEEPPDALAQSSGRHQANAPDTLGTLEEQHLRHAAAERVAHDVRPFDSSGAKPERDEV